MLNRLWDALRPRRAVFIYHPDYARAAGPTPLDPERADDVLAFLFERRLIRRADVSRPRPASLENLLRAHDAAYLDALSRAETVAAAFGAPLAHDEAEEIVARQRLMAGGTIQATRLAFASGRVAFHLGGGLHHAAPDRGMGFCVLNDIAVAIRRLRARGFADPVLVIDLDLHHGNGTRAAFRDDASVHAFSIHNASWDDAPALASTDIALGSGVTDDVYLDALRTALPPVYAAHQPGLVLYVAGTDPAADDKMGDWKISAAGLLARDRFVTELVRSGRRTPLVVLLGGGYGTSAWRYTARYCAWLLTGQVHEPPDDMTIVLNRFRPIARELAGAARAGPDDWGLSDGDLAGLAPGAPRETKVLGFFSRLGLELLLERLGFFRKLGDRGYPRAVLDVDLGTGLWQTIRIWSDPERTAALMELRVSRSRTLVPGMEVLFVEWLALQNPRLGFAGGFAPLPGQEHPGLGMFRDVAGWLVVASETIGLDGIAAMPAHYYLAVLGSRHLRFVRPEAQARFEALRETLGGLSLLAASRALDAGRVVDAATDEPVRWEPEAAVLPVSVRLKALVTGPQHEEAVRRAKHAFRLLDAKA